MDNGITLITNCADEWEYLCHEALTLKAPDTARLEKLLSNTCKVLKRYSKEILVPRDICRLLLTMDEFLYFSSLMEKNESDFDFHNFCIVSNIVSSLKRGFLEGNLEHVSPAEYGRDPDNIGNLFSLK